MIDKRIVFYLAFLLSLGLSASRSWAQVQVLTQHNDNSRTGVNLNETVLTTANVNYYGFGKLFTIPVDGFVFAQPLYMTIGGQNVLFVATAHDSVYAFNADTGAQLWRKSLGPAVPSSVINEHNILVEVGIIGTPVIDPVTETLYVVAKTFETNNQIFRLHALDILNSGAEKFGGPIQIHAPPAQVPGTGAVNKSGQVLFIASEENQRPALTLANGLVYVAFASHEDRTPYHGWVIAYSAATLAQVGVFNTSPNGGSLGGAGIWMSGQGLVADNNNNVYCITGNSFQSDDNAAGDFGESFLKLGGNPLQVVDYFKVFDYHTLDGTDLDLGSGGPVAIPGPAGKTFIVGSGKQGILYVVDTTNMGKFNPTTDQVVQKFQSNNGLWGEPIFWNNTLYVWARNDPLKAFSYNLSTGKFNTTPVAVSSVKTPTGEDPCAVLSLTSNAGKSGTNIVWATFPLADPDHTTVAGKLYAFDATNVAKELYDSGQQSARDNYGNFAKFCPPTVANGKVYVATDSKAVVVYGLLHFSVGDHIKVVTPYSSLNVRNASGTVIGTQPPGALGVITAGPTVIPNNPSYTGPSWDVNFTSGPDGWVRQPYIELQ